MEKETNKSTKQFEMTDRMLWLANQLSALEKAKVLVMRPVGVFKNKYDSDAVIAVAEAVGKKQIEVWREIASVYPEVQKGNWRYSYSKTSGTITKD